jgi:hypothetical protein
MKLRQIAPVAVLAIAALLTGCTGQSSNNSDDTSPSHRPSTRPTSDAVVDTFFGLELKLPTDRWTTTVSGEGGTFAEIVYDDQPADSTDCVQVACPTLLIQTDADPIYTERVQDGEMIVNDWCAQGASAFKSPAFKRTVKIAGMTARYYESAPCAPGGPTRRDWLLPTLLITEAPGDGGQLSEDAFDKLLEGAVKTD